MSKYIIGIDLGTTNCTMAYTALEGEEIVQWPILQTTEPGTTEKLSSLPSFIYLPLKEERAKKSSFSLPWSGDNNGECIGVYARERGGEVAGCVVASAKSWLCHGAVDREAPLLPVNDGGGDEVIGRMSPVDACVKLLAHLKNSWDGDNGADAPFTEQKVIITVPASFDPEARDLVLLAAKRSGYPDVVLMEEPQAAFYHWLDANDDSWRQKLSVGDLVLVVDIGGGTTDFTLIAVGEQEGTLTLERRAVGSHLLLGGDNIDLSLAYLAKDKLEAKKQLIDERQMQLLIHQCRLAKEKLLGEEPPASVDVTVVGKGSKLVGGTVKVKITREEAYSAIVDGFFPIVPATEWPARDLRSALTQQGLPYAEEGRITCQLAKFLSRTGESDEETLESFVLPKAVLFTGGTLKAMALRQRIVEQLNAWAKQLEGGAVIELDSADYDFAVSRGATYYGLARQGRGVRIRSGSPRSYFIGIEEARPAVPGRPAPLKAFCIVPFGMEEGTEQYLDGKEFTLRVGERARFRFFSHSTASLVDGSVPQAGTPVKNWQEELSELAPIETLLEKKGGDAKCVAVKIKSRITELGALELLCQSHDGEVWKLEFASARATK